MRVIARLNMGGPARHAALLDAGLRRLGYDTLLVYGTPGAAEGSLEHLVSEHGVPGRHVPALGPRINPLGDVRAFVEVLRILRDVEPDLVHTHTAKAGALGRVAATLHNATLPRRKRCRIVHTFHGHVLDGYFSPAGNALVRWAERALGLLSDRIVAISETQRRDLVERFRVAPARKVTIVPLGLDLERLLALQPSLDARLALGVEHGAFVVTFVGRFVPIKNVPLLLEAFALLARGVPCARLLLAGEGPLRPAIEARAHALGLERSVTFLGWRDDLAPVYAASDVVALTSRNEGTPVSLIEAMAAARPVVATAVGGVVDLVNDGRTGRLVAPDDAASFGAALLELARDPAGRGRLGEAARENVRLRFTAGRLVGDVDRLYGALLQPRA